MRNDSSTQMPFSRAVHRSSPLWMVTQEPQLTQLVVYLDRARERILAAQDSQHELVFSRDHIDRVRSGFAEVIRKGEAKLHRLCALLCDDFLDLEYELQSVVIGEMPASKERFTLSQPLGTEQLYAQTDLDLGNRLLG
ncbi:MAG: hypothetical protein KC561_15080, partial [Myxococcales bacterium]|nr:hypothetical protein [Myxococcales bacterium]